jgi:hypothetical protein
VGDISQNTELRQNYLTLRSILPLNNLEIVKQFFYEKYEVRMLTLAIRIFKIDNHHNDRRLYSK